MRLQKPSILLMMLLIATFAVLGLTHCSWLLTGSIRQAPRDDAENARITNRLNSVTEPLSKNTPLLQSMQNEMRIAAPDQPLPADLISRIKSVIPIAEQRIKEAEATYDEVEKEAASTELVNKKVITLKLRARRSLSANQSSCIKEMRDRVRTSEELAPKD